MKSLLLFLLVLMLFQSSSYSQDINQNFSFYQLSKEKLLHPNEITAGKNDLPGIHPELLKGKLNKEIFGQNGTVYRPAVIRIDSGERIYFTYDSRGNRTVYLSQKPGVGGSWVNDFRVTCTYDENNNQTSNFYEVWKNGDWVSGERVHYTYDEKGHELIYLRELWIEGYWVNAERRTSTYDANGNMLQQLAEQWNGGWENSFRYTYTYDSNNRMLTNLNEKWSIYGTWEPLFRVTYAYDNDGNITLYFDEEWQNGAWENSEKDVWTYENGRIVNYLIQKWQNGAWQNTTRRSYIYGGSDSLYYTLLSEAWTYDKWAATSKSSIFVVNDGTKYITLLETVRDGIWSNASKTTTNYRKTYCILNSLQEVWSNGAWVNKNKQNLTYDNNGNAVKAEAFEWKNDAWTPFITPLDMRYNDGADYINFSGSVVEVEYSQLSGVENNPSAVNDFSLAQNYPNPFNPSTTINFSIQTAGNIKLTVYDALGRKLALLLDEYKPAGSHSVKFNAGSLPSGVYLYRLDAGKYTASRKFILMK